MSLSDARKGPAGAAGLATELFFKKRARLLGKRLRLLAAEERLWRCADKIALRQFAELLEALERPKPRALKANHDHQCIAIAVEDFRMRKIAEGKRSWGLREQGIREVIFRRGVSERTIRTALKRYGKVARELAKIRHR